MVGDHHDPARLGNDGLRELGLLRVEVHEAAVQVDGADRKQRHPAAEALDEAHRLAAEQGAVVAAQLAADQEHPVAVAARQGAGDLRAVGDQHEVAVIDQLAGDVGGGAAGVHHEGVAVLHLGRGEPRNGLLGLGVLHQALAKARLAQLVGHAHPAVDLAHQPLAGHDPDVPPDGLAGDLELAGELRHGAAAARRDGFQDGRLPGRSEHVLLPCVRPLLRVTCLSLSGIRTRF